MVESKYKTLYRVEKWTNSKSNPKVAFVADSNDNNTCVRGRRGRGRG